MRSRRMLTLRILTALAPALGLFSSSPARADVRVVGDSAGLRLQVDGKDFWVKGVNWDYVPIGQNYNYSLWSQPDDVIEEALKREATLLQRMGVNAVRQYAGIPPRWVRHLYERYGIYTVLNHPVGRYGMTLDGAWVPSVDYSNPAMREALKEQVLALQAEFKDTPGVLFWLLGNENNYGLTWSSFEIENLPQGERDAARARYLYSLFGEITRELKARDPSHPVAIANGDLQYIDLIAQECKGLDIFGANVYRGASARDLFQVVHDKLHLPVVFTEFGADAYDAKRQREDDLTQARTLVAQWREIYEQSSGKGRVGNAVGGFVFQWSDGWWKYRQETNLDVHDTAASWASSAYPDDYVEGENNMNEEWWGLCAKGPPDGRGLYDLSPRTAYYALQQAFRLPAYAPDTDAAAIEAHFAAIDPPSLAFHYQAESAARSASALGMARVTGARMNFETYATGGANATSGFDHMESFYADFQLQPTERVVGNLSLAVIGNVAQNPLDKIFYENRPSNLASVTGASTFDRLRLYKASVAWDGSYFTMNGFFRAGHYHWGYEGDFFGLYREANYGPNIDIYNADVPIGVEIAGKRELDGLKVAFGPQLWWAANPALFVKYRHRFGAFELTALDEEQIGSQTTAATSAAIPEKHTRKSSLQVATWLGPANIELGGLWSGSPKVGKPFLQLQGGQTVLDHITANDTLGAKAKVTVESGRFHWYAQSAYMGLVADAGPTGTTTFTGWTLKDSGSGNQVNALTGLAVNLGPFQLGPNALWQKPLVGPGPSINPNQPLRNALDDEFVVRANREMLAGELMLAFDPTPATWLWTWDNDLREDAPFAGSVDFVFRHMPTSQDAALYIGADGKTPAAFTGATPARDLWETNARFVSRLRGDLRLVGHAFVGEGEPNGDSPRVVHRYGGDLRVAWSSIAVVAYAKFNDWGPYDYYRDFNSTYPLQLMADVSHTLGTPRWLGLHQAKVGVRGTYRFLNGYSPSFDYPSNSPATWGKQYEVRTYLVLAL